MVSMLAVTPAQMSVFEDIALKAFCARLRETFMAEPEPVGARAAERPVDWYEAFARRAADWGIVTEADVAGLTHLLLRAGPGWLPQPLIREVLENPALPPATKVFQVRDVLWDQPYAK